MSYVYWINFNFVFDIGKHKNRIVEFLIISRDKIFGVFFHSTITISFRGHIFNSSVNLLNVQSLEY